MNEPLLHRRSPWHIVTGEFPPRPGGVSDYTMQLSAAMAAAGSEVHVWCPADGPSAEVAGVTVHDDLGSISPSDLRTVGRMLDASPPPRRLLVQWVPHAFGYRSMNMHFCTWLLRRARRFGDDVDLMVHEPFLPFAGNARQRAAAAVHRAMTVVLLRAATRIWISVPAWERRLRPYLLGRRIPMRWLPIPSNVVPVEDVQAVDATRRRLTSAPTLVGHFGTYGTGIARPLRRVLVDVLRADDSVDVVLLGRTGPEFRDGVVAEAPELAGRLRAPGPLGLADLSIHLQACDVMIQPFPDGISTRRTTAMACLAHGRAVVSTTGEHSEPFWTGEEAVSLAPEGDAAALEREVRVLLADPERRARMGDAAKRLYDERFAIGNVVDALRAST